MTGRPVLWDRLSGAPALAPSAQTLSGRYLTPDDGQSYSLGNRAVQPGDYLSGGSGGWTMWRDGDDARWSGGFHPNVLPDPLIVDSVSRTARKLFDLLGEAAPVSRWLAEPYLVADMDQRLRAGPLEKQIRKDLGHLAAVCRAPHARLHTEHVLVPVSKARAITWRTVSHLAAHSETWAARRLRGVEPAKLLTPVTLPDHDLYENQVVAALVDGLWRHVLDRISELNSIHELIVHGQDFLDEARERPSWRDRERLFEDISELLSDRNMADRLTEERGRLEGLRVALAPLLASRLRRGVRTPYSGPPRLRPTNLFVNNVHYRHCRSLWDSWIRLRRRDDRRAVDDETVANWCHDFIGYAALVVLRALAQLGADLTGHDSDPPWPRLGFRYRSAEGDITWNDDETFTVSLGDGPVIRIVPLPHALTASQDAHLAEEALTDVAITAHRTAVLYPADPRERKALPMGARLRFHSSRPVTYGDVTLPAMVPVSPLDINSVGRTARLIRTALDERILLDYPARVTCPTEVATSLAGSSEWIEKGQNELLIISPPDDDELATFLDALSHLRLGASRVHRRGDNRDIIQGLITDVKNAVAGIRALTSCPVCGRPAFQPGRAFQKRENGTYWCNCSGCGTEWGTRRCVLCRKAHAVLVAPGAEERVGGDGDLIDHRFSQDVLALPCWVRARSYICSACGKCPEIGTPNCVRCKNGPESFPATPLAIPSA